MDTSTIQRGADVPYMAETSIDTSKLDEVGRALTLRGCPMYVRAALLESRTDDYYLHLEHNGQIRAKLYWDTTEDLDWSRSRIGDRIHALVFLVEISRDHVSQRLLDLSVTELLLKPNVRPFEYHEAENRGLVWQRCGSFKGRFSEPNDDLYLVEGAFQLRRFGIRLVHAGDGSLRLQSTSEAPDLEDICIV
jgi:hypothetical protein